MELPIFKLVIDEESEAGVSFVALVDQPAIQRNFLAFNEDKRYAFAVESEAQRIISGPLMIPNMAIFRKADGERPDHNVIFEPETIKSIVLKFFKQGNTSNVNMMHNESAQPEGVYMFESFLIDSTRGIKAPEGFSDLPDGTWFGSYKVDNDDVWNEFISTGIFKGFSVEGIFSYAPTESKEEKMLREIIDVMKS